MVRLTKDAALGSQALRLCNKSMKIDDMFSFFTYLVQPRINGIDNGLCRLISSGGKCTSTTQDLEHLWGPTNENGMIISIHLFINSFTH